MFGFHLTRSRRNFSAIYYGIIPSNLLAFEAAARVRAKQGAGSMERRGSRRGLGIRVRIGIGGSEDTTRLGDDRTLGRDPWGRAGLALSSPARDDGEGKRCSRR